MPNLKRNPLILAVLFTIIIALFGIITTIIFKVSTREVEVLITPASSTITINGKKYENGTHNLPAGEVSVHIEKPGFITQDFIFDTTTKDKLYAYLLQEDGSFSWYETHQADDIILTTIGDYQTATTANNYFDSHPIASLLPIVYANYDESYNYTEFRIDGGSFKECSSDFCLKITDVTGDNLDLAKQLLKERGINPSDYEILYEYSPIIPLK